MAELHARPRVAHVTTVDMSLRYLLLDQMRSLQACGYDVVGISAPGPHVPVIEAAGIRHLAIPVARRFAPMADLRALWHLYRTLRRERFTIVHTHTPKGGLLGQYAALLARVPIRLHTIHGLYFPAGASPRLRRAFVLLERITMRFSQLNLSQNVEDVAVAVAERISPPARIRHLGNGIDLARFAPGRFTAERRAAIRASLGLAPHHRVVGIVARFVAEKGYRELLEAAREVSRQLPDARFVLVGGTEGEKGDALDPGIIDRMHLQDTVLHLGHRSDVPDLYATMDVLALPSYREGFPRAPMEAAAAGVPAVVTDIRGNRQAVEHRRTGLLVPVRDPVALAEALLELLRDEPLRLAYGRAAHQKALAEFDQRDVFARVRDAYVELLGRHRASRGTEPALGVRAS